MYIAYCLLLVRQSYEMPAMGRMVNP